MVVRRLRRDIYLVTGSPNTLVVVEGDHGLMVDLGFDEKRGRETIRYFEEKHGVREFTLVFTHAHPDHIGAATNLSHEKLIHRRELSIAESSVLRETLIYGARAPRRLFSIKSNNIGVDKVFEWGEKIGLLETIALPGHSIGHTGFTTGDIVYVGDSVFGQRLLDRIGVPFHPDHRSSIESMKKILELARSDYTLVVSHGPVARKNKAIELIEANINRLEELEKRILDLLEKPLDTMRISYKLTKTYTENPSIEQVFLNEVTVKSIISWLYDEGLIEPIIENERIAWTRKG